MDDQAVDRLGLERLDHGEEARLGPTSGNPLDGARELVHELRIRAPAGLVVELHPLLDREHRPHNGVKIELEGPAEDRPAPALEAGEVDDGDGIDQIGTADDESARVRAVAVLRAETDEVAALLGEPPHARGRVVEEGRVDEGRHAVIVGDGGNLAERERARLVVEMGGDEDGGDALGVKRLLEILVGGGFVGSDQATSHEDLEQALDPERVAAVFVPAHLDDEPGALPLREVAAIAHDHGVPTLVDAAFLNYPPASMRRFTEEGGDLVCFSAKYCYGPNTGGFVVGRSDLVDAVAVVDFTGFESGRWAIFGRPFKLDLHTIVGTVLAVEEWMELDHEAPRRAYAGLVGQLGVALQGIPGGRT